MVPRHNADEGTDAMKIEITPEMVESGEDLLCDGITSPDGGGWYCSFDGGMDGLVRAIYEAMRALEPSP